MTSDSGTFSNDRVGLYDGAKKTRQKLQTKHLGKSEKNVYRTYDVQYREQKQASAADSKLHRR